MAVGFTFQTTSAHGTGTVTFNPTTASSTATTIYSNAVPATTTAAFSAQMQRQLQMQLQMYQHLGSMPSAAPAPYPYAPPPRNFSRYLNASDLLEEFVRYCKTVGGVRQRDFMALPVELFIHWLMIRAAEADGEPRPADVPDPKVQLLTLAKSPWGSRCRDCGRFIPERQALIGVVFCSGAHFDRYRSKQLQAA